jgi:hypothetical protein
MSGDLFEILFVLAFILLGLLGGRKKKPGAGQPQVPRPMPRPRPGSPPTARRAPTVSRPARPPAPPETTQDVLLRELEGLLTGRRPGPVEQAPTGAPAPVHRVPDPDEARSLETLEVEETAAWEAGIERASEARETARWTEGRDRAPVTLETLEEAGESSHARFHERYAATAAAQPAVVEAPEDGLRHVRRAVVWAEILGPPVSLR